MFISENTGRAKYFLRSEIGPQSPQSRKSSATLCAGKSRRLRRSLLLAAGQDSETSYRPNLLSHGGHQGLGRLHRRVGGQEPRRVHLLRPALPLAFLPDQCVPLLEARQAHRGRREAQEAAVQEESERSRDKTHEVGLTAISVTLYGNRFQLPSGSASRHIPQRGQRRSHS